MNIPSLLLLNEFVSFNPVTQDIIFTAILVVVLLGCSAFTSATEMSFFSLLPQHLDALEPYKNKSDASIVMLRADSERTLATLLISNNLINVLIIMLSNNIFGRVIVFKEEWLEFLCLTVLLTFIILLFGEIMPKIYSRQNPLSFCRKSVSTLLVLRKILRPISWLLLQSGVIAEKAMPKEVRKLSVDDLEQALELTNQNEILDEQSMLRGIIRFGGETVKEVMTSRQDMVMIEIKSDFKEVLRCIEENNYSRIPVYQDNNDNIRGVLYIKDLLPHLSKPANFRWQSLIRAAYFVPGTKEIDALLREFQENKAHMAIVVDEYGGTSGLVTLEDILEEIVGEINDEYDEDEKSYTQLNKNTYVFEGKTLLSDFCKILKVDNDEFDSAAGDADTLAGLLLELKGDFPIIHEKIDFMHYTFEVVEIEERRISRIKVTLHDEKVTPDAPDQN